jgi:hypothetical protein
MNAPLLAVEWLEARALAANSVRSAFFERFGSLPCDDDRLWELKPDDWYGLVADIELKLGVAFRDEDIEFLETPNDLVERATAVLAGARS